MTHSATDTLKISFLPSATIEPVTFITLSDTLNRATTLMELNDFSQLPVVRGGGKRPVGAISWQSIGQALSRGEGSTLEECVDKNSPQVGLDDDLLTAIPTINKSGFVIVVDARRNISGIVTSADLGQALADIARPFLLVERCENELRRMVRLLLERKGLSQSDLNAALARPKFVESHTPDDLTFGDLVSIVTNEKVWGKFDSHYNRIELKQALDKISKLRNTLMHFREQDLAFDSAAQVLPRVAVMLSSILT